MRYRNQIIIIFSILAAAYFSGCVMNKLDDSPKTIVVRENSEGMSISLDVDTGEEWASRMQAGPFIFNILPQMAIWIADEQGRYLETLWVTGADFKKMKHAQKNGSGPAFFADCLPVWASRLQAAGKSLPSKENPYPDTVTSATPMGDFTLETKTTSGVPMILYAEVNKSGDTSSFYTEDANDWVGQPSLIYMVEIRETGKVGALRMELSGHGGLLEQEPGIYFDLSGFETAVRQIDKITVSFE